MPINMTDYRMIINERVYNVLQIIIDFAGPLEDGKPPKPKFIDAVYIDEDGTIKTIRDEAWCFQFVRRKAYECGGACSMQLLRGQPECAGYISRRKRK